MKLTFFVFAILTGTAAAANLRTRRAPGDNGEISTATSEAIAAQGLDAAGRDSTSEANEAAVRADRKSSFSGIESLLAKLRKFVNDERARVDRDHQADVDKAAKQRDDEIAAADKVRDDKIEALRLMVVAKTEDRDNKKTIHEGKVAVHDTKVTAHEEDKSALAKSKEIQDAQTPIVEAENKNARGSCAANDARTLAAADAQLKKDLDYLSEAQAFVGELRTSLTDFQDVEASTKNVKASTCKGVVCPKDICPDGKGRRQVGSDCCSCAETEAGRLAVEASDSDIAAQQSASDADIAVKVNADTQHKASEHDKVLADQAANAEQSGKAHEAYTTEKGAEYENNRYETALLSIHEQTKLHGLMATLVSSDPKYLNSARLQLRSGQVGLISKALDAVETRILEEKKEVKAADASNRAAIAQALNACQKTADDAKEAALANMAATVERATKAEAVSREERRIAKDEMDKAKDILDAAEAALVEALRIQEEETRLANEEYERKKAASIQQYNEAKASFDKKESDAYTYLDGEMDLIDEIQAALDAAGKVGTNKLMMLAQMSQRLTNHVKRRLQARYIDGLQGQQGIEDKITSMLDSIEQSLKLELENSSAQKDADTTTVNKFYTDTEAAAKKTRDDKLKALQDEVDAAQKERDTADSELKTAQAEENVAKNEMDEADAYHKAMLKQQEELSKIAKDTLEREHADQDQMRKQNLALVESKRADALKYLGQERATVDNIEKLLANLGKDYKFTIPPTSEGGFLEVQEAAGQTKMSVQQKEALATLVSLLGRNGVQYSGEERVFGGSDHSDAQKVIADVLQQVRDAIQASEDEVQSNHKKDTAQVEKEYKDAWDASEAKYAAEIARLQKAVDDAKAVLDHETTVWEGKVAVRKEKERVLAEKEAKLQAAKDKQRIEGDFARRTYEADEAAAATYKRNRLAQINDEHASDVKFISEEQQAITEIRAALAQIDFRSMLEEAAKYDESQTTYMATNSFDLKTEMLKLLAGIEGNVNAELERADREFTDDMTNNKLEKARADEEAQKFHDKDIADLQKAVDDARAEFKDSDAALDRANKAHAIAADQHQEDLDDLATAKAIEAKNEPMLESQYQKSKKNADQVFAEEMEILRNKKSRGDFYLKTNTDGLASIDKMLKNLDVTTTDTAAKPDTEMYNARAEYTTNLQDGRFSARTDAESARIAVASDEAAAKSFTVKSTNGDDILMGKDAEGNVDRKLTEHAADTKGYAQRVEFDDRGNAIKGSRDEACTYQDSVSMIGALSKHKECDGTDYTKWLGWDESCPCFTAVSKETAVAVGSCTWKAEGFPSMTLPQAREYCLTTHAKETKEAQVAKAEAALAAAKAAFLQVHEGNPVGDFIGALAKSTDAEALKSQREYDAEVAKVTKTRDDITSQARNERDRLLKIDDERTAAATKAADKTGETLAMALATKNTATARHKTAAATLNDALLTQEKNVPLVKQMLKDTFAFNQETFERANADVTSKKKEADTYLNDELAMVAEIRKLVNEKIGLAYPALMEMVAHLVSTHAAKLGSRTHAARYDFAVREAKRFSDKQDVAGEDYMTKGTVAKNDYGAKAGSISGMLDANAKRIEDEIVAVAKRHEDDMAFLTKERKDALTAATAKRDATVAALQAIVDDATAAFKAADKARSDQEEKRNAARGVLDAKQGELNAAMALQNSEMAVETDIKDETDAATVAHFGKQMQFYDDEELRANNIIDREMKVLADIRSILADDKLGKAAEEGAAVDACVSQKKDYDAAVNAAISAADACTRAQVAKAGNDPFDATACDSATSAAAAKEAAGAVYKGCLANPASVLVKTALVELNALAKKYIGDAEYNAGTASDIQAALAVVAELEGKLNEERANVKSSVASDREAETKLREDKFAKALGRWTDSRDKNAAAVKAATGARNTAKAAWRSEYDEWSRLLGVQNDKEEELRAAKDKYVREKKIAEDLKLAEDLNAETRYATEKGKVDDIKRKDTAYLKSEVSAIAKLKDMVAKLNAKGLL